MTAPAPVTPVTPVIPPLPSWTDPASVISYITSVAAVVFTNVTIATGKGEPAAVQALLPSVGAIVAGVAQTVNVLTHRGVQKAVLVAQAGAPKVTK